MSKKPERPEWMWFLVGNDDEREIICSKEFPKMRSSGGKWTSSSGWHSSKEELIAKQGILENLCAECGRIISTNYTEPYKTRLRERGICFSCNHWVDMMNLPNPIRINGEHYQDGGSGKDWCGFRGFGGRKFVIKMHDGKILKTDNLWTQGKIPTHFRSRLPDNAEFVS